MLTHPNPMYIFTKIEERILRSFYIPIDYREKHSLTVFNASFAYPQKRRSDVKKYISGMSVNHDKIIISGGFRSTLTVPHHIHEDGSMEEQPGRKGPIRTYFDGSSIAQLGHAAAICIDKKQGTITTQCPKGRELDKRAVKLLGEIFQGYSHETIRFHQQEDQHSCVALTLLNTFALAGVMPPQQSVDVMAWRSTLLHDLKRLEKVSVSSPDSDLKKAFEQNRTILAQTYHGTLPVYCQKYADLTR